MASSTDNVTASRTDAPRWIALPPGKVTAPPLAEHALPRAVLDRRVHEALRHGSLAVTAPAGSGKTHLLSRWFHDHRAGPRVWLTLDDADRDPVTFLHSLLGSVRLVDADARALTGLRPPMPVAVEPVDPAYLREVAQALGRLTEPVVVVLDDLHRLTESPAERLLRRLLHTSPEPLRLALVSRGTPRVGLERAERAGWLAQLTAADLALTPAEVEELIRIRASPPATRPAALEVWRRTHGWMLGALIEVDDLPTGRRRTMLEDFFDLEVLASMPPRVRRLVERAVTVDPVCGRLVDVLAGQENGGAEALEALHHDGVFLEPSGPDDEHCAWYRWQPQFRTVLAERLARRDEGSARSLHRAAARWLRTEGRTGESAEHALAAGDRTEAAETVTREWLTLLHTGRVAELDEALSLFTEEERATHPELAAACAVIRAVENDLTRSCRCAEQALATSGPRADDARLTIEAAAAGVHLYRATLTGIEDGTPDTARLLLERLDPRRGPRSDSELALRGHLAHLLGVWDVQALELDEAQQLLTEVVELGTRLGDRALVLRSQAQLARVDANAGHLTRALDRARMVLEAPAGTTPPQAAMVAEIATAEVLLLRGHPLEALGHLTAALRLAPPEDPVSRAMTAILAMIAMLALGRVTGAREQLEVLHSELPGGRSAVPVLHDQLRLAEARQLLSEGAVQDALRALPGPTKSGTPLLGTRVATARAWARYLLHEEPDEAAEPVAATQARTPDGIAALVLDALVAHRSGRADQALGTLETALRHSAVEQVALPFLLMATELRPLLQDLVTAGTAHEEWALQLLEVMAAPPTAAPRGVPYVEPLTPRELEVLRALQGTLPAEEVAGRLFVSMNTLRTHIKHINRKLGTGSRREAVARARELALL